MPELPDIALYLEALSPRVLNQPLERVRVANPFLVRTPEPPISSAEGRLVLGLRRLGKRIVFVLEGDLTVRVGEDTFSAAPGSFVFCPRDVPHLLTLHSEQARTLTLVTPGGLESFFIELGEPAPGRRTLPDELPEPDLERVVTLAGHYGAEVLTDWP